MIDIYNYMGTRYDNSIAVQIGNLLVYFSYRTIIGFRWKGVKVGIKKTYSATTSKHQRNIGFDILLEPDKFDRAFYKALREALKECIEEHPLLSEVE